MKKTKFYTINPRDVVAETIGMKTNERRKYFERFFQELIKGDVDSCTTIASECIVTTEEHRERCSKSGKKGNEFRQAAKVAAQNEHPKLEVVKPKKVEEPIEIPRPKEFDKINVNNLRMAIEARYK
jgi:hypothetical protein